MSCQFFSPKPDSSGCALYVSFNSKDAYVMLQLRKQTSWNTETKTASFIGGQSILLKLSPDEVGGIIHSIRVCGTTKFYHNSPTGVTTGQFSYYELGEAPNVKRGFGISLKRDEIPYKVGLTEGSAERLMEYLKFALEHIFSADYAKDKAAAKERFEKKQTENQSPAPAKQVRKPRNEPQPAELNGFDAVPPQEADEL